MDSRDNRSTGPDYPLWRRMAARFVRALSNLLAASEPKRKRPRNLYVQGMTTTRLVTRPYSE